MDDQLFDAAASGDVSSLSSLLDRYPERLQARILPYEWSLLHVAAHHGHLEAVDLLLKRGLDVNTREKGDNTYAMHWAAAAGCLDIVRRLADAGGDVIGHGDDHGLDVIGWAVCGENGSDADHRAVADFLVNRGARHHIFSAIALNQADEVRRIVAADPAALSSRQSRNENHRMPLHYAVMANRPEMVSLLLQLGADPLATDGSGQPAAIYATTSHADRAVMEKIRAMTAAEFVSAERGSRTPNVTMLDLLAAIALRDWPVAERILKVNACVGTLHVMAKRNDVEAMKWLLDHGADPNARWAHWDSDVMPLHLAVLGGHADAVRTLLDHGANPRIRDSKHDSDAIGWAEFFRRAGLVRILQHDDTSA